MNATDKRDERDVISVCSLQAVTWGRAFQFTDEAATLAYLGNRESNIGGYTTIIAQFYPRDPKDAPFPVLVYIALPSNPHYLGPASVDTIATQIAMSKGTCGYNVEYLAKLAAFMHIHVPEVWDEHVYELEFLVRKALSERYPQLLHFFADAIIHEGIDNRKCDKAKNEPNFYDYYDEEPETDNTNGFESVVDLVDESINGSPIDGIDDSVSSSSSASTSSTSLQSDMPSKYADTVPLRQLRCLNK